MKDGVERGSVWSIVLAGGDGVWAKEFIRHRSAMKRRSNTVSGRKSLPATDYMFLGCGVYNCRDLSTLCFFSVPNQANLLPW